MSKYSPAQILPLGLCWLARRWRYAWWGLVNRIPPARFRRLGRRVKFNGWLRVEKPCADIQLGDDVMMGLGCYLLATPTGRIRIGRNVGVNDYCFITSHYGIEIGDNVLIAENVSIRDYDHEFADPAVLIKNQGLRGGPISIGEDTWLAKGVIVTGNVRIGRGCVIGANSVVTRDIPDFSVAVGAPARVVKRREARIQDSEARIQDSGGTDE